MKHTRVRSVLVFMVWIYLCESVNVQYGNHVKNNAVKGNSFASVGHTVTNGGDFSVNILHGLKLHGRIVPLDENGDRNMVESSSDQRERSHKNDIDSAEKRLYSKDGGSAGEIPLQMPGEAVIRSNSRGYDRTVYTNMDSHIQTPRKSILDIQPIISSNYRHRNDITFLDVKYSANDADGKHNPKSKVIRGHYQRKGLWRVAENVSNTMHADARHNLNILSRQKRRIDSKKNGRSEPAKLVGRQSRVGRSAPNTSHMDQNLWPDKSSRNEMKLISPFLKADVFSKSNGHESLNRNQSAAQSKDNSVDTPSELSDNPSRTTVSFSVEHKSTKTISIPSTQSTTLEMSTDPSKPRSQASESINRTPVSPTSVSPANSVSITPSFQKQTSHNPSAHESSRTVFLPPPEAVTETSEPKAKLVLVPTSLKPTTEMSSKPTVTASSELTTQDSYPKSTTPLGLTTRISPELTTKMSLKPTSESFHEPITKHTFSMPTIKPSPEPNPGSSPEPTTESTLELSPEPTPQSSSEPTPKVSSKSTTIPSPEPTTTSSPDQKKYPVSKVETQVTEPSTKPTTIKISPKPTKIPPPPATSMTSIEPTTATTSPSPPKTSRKPTTETFPKPTTQAFPKPKTATPHTQARTTIATKQTSEYFTETKTEISRMPTPESSPEPTTKTSPEPSTKSNPEPQTHPESTIEESETSTKPSPEEFTLKTTLPISFEVMADETYPDDISNTTYLNASNTTQSHNPSTSTSTSTTKLPTTAADLTSTVKVLPESTAKPEHTSTSGPTPSREPTNEGDDPEPERGPQPEPERDGSTPASIAEPGPDWAAARKKWSIAWEIHLYLLGGVFVLIASYTLLSLVKLYHINRLLSKKYFVTLNLLVLLLCTLRAVFLLVDGYNANGTFPPVVNYLLYSTGFPCLTSAFSILLYSLLQATQMRLVPPRVQKIHVLITVIFFHFALQITTDILVGTYAGVSIMLFVCQLVFIGWGLFLFIGYAYIFRHLYSSAVKRQKNYQYMLSGKSYINNTESYKQKFTLSLAVKVTFLAAIFGLVTIALEMYSIVGVYGVFQDKKPDPWPWWTYHTALRLVECLMCIIMAYVASQPFRCRDIKTCSLFCAPCLEIFQCASKENASDGLGWSEYDRLSLSSSKRSNGHVDAKKKKIYRNEGTNIVPIVIQTSMTQESRPLSMLIIEDGYVRFQAETDINKLVDNYARAQGATEMSTFSKGCDGIVNGAYIRSMEDTVRFQDDTASSDGYARKSRKSSLASSGFFRPPSSLSLADSMESEIEKAFQSMHQEDSRCASTRSLPSQSTYSMEDYIQGPAIEAYLEQQAQQPASLQRSRSSLGDLNIPQPSSWRQKLFRSMSESSGGVRTKDVDNLQYESLLDLEKQEEARAKRYSVNSEGSREGMSSDGSYTASNLSSSRLTADRDVEERLLRKGTGDSEEIDV